MVQRYTQASADLNVVRNLEQLQADLTAFPLEQDITTNNASNLTPPKTYPFDFDDEENFYAQPSFRKRSSSSSMNAMSSYLEKERPTPLSGRRPFDAFGVCAAEADMLKQVSGDERCRQENFQQALGMNLIVSASDLSGKLPAEQMRLSL